MELKTPFFQDSPSGKRLIVRGEQFLILGAELQNSSLTSASYMKGVWPKLAAANVNTVLGCVTWEQIEPEEGQFDFDELDHIILDARGHGLHLVLLWFGSFKNGMSVYTPTWVKTDQKRFPRAKLAKKDGGLETGNVLSVFYPQAPKADAKAFTALMQHLREVDESHSTVIMVQVENEVGLLGDTRDRSKAANRAFNSPVPQIVIDILTRDWDNLNDIIKGNLKHFDSQTTIDNTSWESVFGPGPRTDEIFMAYHYALFLEQVAANGKEVYPLPLYTNAWLSQVEDGDSNFTGIVSGGAKPGNYPSGGPVVQVIDIWQLFAPTFSFIAPDIYDPNYDAICTKYLHRRQPLFIPEQRRDEIGARRIWPAFGQHGAIGTSPFGIDTIDPIPYTKHYGLLKLVKAHYLESLDRPNSTIGFFFDDLNEDGSDPSPAFDAELGGWKLTIARAFVFGKPSAGFGMIIHQKDSKFLLVGEGFQVDFKSQDPNKPFAGILSFAEKEVINAETGELRTLRMLNGDETRGGVSLVMPSENPDYGKFHIAITIPARTGIAECELYALEFNDEE